MKTKIQIKSIFGEILFEFEKINNSVKETLQEAIKHHANLSYANLSYANLSYANISSVNLSSADLSSADLSYADLSSANLSYADLSYANLSYANLSYANLRSADLSSANLSSANLSDADLSYANLSYTVTNKRYIQMAGIGSAKRMTTYCFEDNKVWCGCFIGNLEEFEKQVHITHVNNPQYLAEYMGFINYLKSLK